MLSPADLEETLSADDLVKVAELVEVAEQEFRNPARYDLEFNKMDPDNKGIPERVWNEFISSARKAKWRVIPQGAVIVIKRPSP
jgi:hypothetical protein